MRLSNLVFSLFASAPTHLHSQSKTPIDCVHRPSVSTLEDLVNCYYDYTVSKHTYDHNSYAAAQPSSLARLAWTDVIASVLAVDTPVHCMYVDVPFSLRDSYQVRLFIERVQDGKPYCVLAEVSQNSGKYVRGWGLMVVPASRALVSRFIHISAPHPVADINTAQQAMALFKHTGAKSLFVAGRHKEAYSADSCVGPQYRTTDPSHDTTELFFDAMKGIRSWQESNGRGCPSMSCAYIQLHGKTSCPSDTTFLSTGLPRDNCSDHWYSTVDSPVRRIRNELDALFPSGNNSLPPDSSCNLLATKNVFGRLLNGVPERSVCTTNAACNSVTGQFVHIEQSSVSRDPLLFGNWSRVVNRAIATTCLPPWQMDPNTLLCRFPTIATAGRLPL